MDAALEVDVFVEDVVDVIEFVRLRHHRWQHHHQQHILPYLLQQGVVHPLGIKNWIGIGIDEWNLDRQKRKEEKQFNTYAHTLMYYRATRHKQRRSTRITEHPVLTMIHGWHADQRLWTDTVGTVPCMRQIVIIIYERTNQFKWQLSCNEGVTDELYIGQWYPVNIEWLPSAFQSRDLHDYGCLYWNVRNNGTIQQFQQRKTSRNINTLVGFGVTILVQSSSITTSTFGVIKFHPIGTNVPYYVSLSSIVISYCLFVRCVDDDDGVYLCGAEGERK